MKLGSAIAVVMMVVMGCAFSTAATAWERSSSKVCMMKEVGFGAAAPCMAKYIRDTSDATLDRILAANIEVLGEHLRAGRISEQDALARFEKLRLEHNAAAVKEEKQHYEQAREAFRSEQMARAWRDFGDQLQFRWSLQDAAKCARWGMC